MIYTYLVQRGRCSSCCTPLPTGEGPSTMWRLKNGILGSAEIPQQWERNILTCCNRLWIARPTLAWAGAIACRPKGSDFALTTLINPLPDARSPPTTHSNPLFIMCLVDFLNAHHLPCFGVVGSGTRSCCRLDRRSPWERMPSGTLRRKALRELSSARGGTTRCELKHYDPIDRTEEQEHARSTEYVKM